MPRSYRYLHYDVFTDHLFGGNQLAVFLDGRGLSSEVMQAIAKEMNFSESTFVLPPERPDTDARMRIFTPGEELPMAGHPTIGSTFALARSGAIEPDRDRFVFGLGIGPVPVALTWRGADLTFAWMTQPNPAFSDPIADPAGAAATLGLSELAVAGTGLPVQVVSCGVPFLFVPLTTRAAVDSASIQRDRFEQFRAETKTQAHGVFLFSSQSGGDKATVYSRMFAPDLGVIEDPATGSASGPLGCYLVRHKVVPVNKAGAILSLQGVKMGRPSHVHISIGVEHEEITSVRVGGEAVLAGEGTLYVV
ncbi:MAG TPA: PhzF family phenazine biosynthesis protein [Vicinamibacterales bacterium]|jgi:trans-2,3-dihydro-3-hydroxyanthranilate isomerase|nr:PhzF family phenazine biosynthesis protein [Vicinamibacterales bacterium]